MIQSQIIVLSFLLINKVFTMIYKSYYSNTVKPLYKKPLYKNIVNTFGWNSTFSTLKKPLYKKIL